MSIEEKVSLTISIEKQYRDRLRTMAAEQNLQDPDLLTSASTIAREIICEHLDKIDKNSNHTKTTGGEMVSNLKTEKVASSHAAEKNGNK
jgi:hypothetical protein